MKNISSTVRLVALAALAGFATLNANLSTAFAQGSLTPPAGTPAPVMKTLDQVEARTAITNAGAFTINASGSYYLTRNITVSIANGITINTNDVTLDLNGFTISSTASPASGSGILLSGGRQNIHIFNGQIRGNITNNGAGVYSGSGFVNGITYSGDPSDNVLVSRIRVTGCSQKGIFLYGGIYNHTESIAESCMVQTVGGSGIRALIVRSSLARDCGDTAIYGRQVSDSRGLLSGDKGIEADTVSNSAGTGDNGGINAETAQNCYGYSSAGTGLFATTALNCVGSSGTGTGLIATTAGNCVGETSSGTHGINAFGTASFCRGSHSGGGVAVNAAIAIGCTANPGTVTSPQKHLGTP